MHSDTMFTEMVQRYEDAWDRLQRQRQHLTRQLREARRCHRCTAELQCDLTRRIRMLYDEQAELAEALFELRIYAQQEVQS